MRTLAALALAATVIAVPASSMAQSRLRPPSSESASSARNLELMKAASPMVVWAQQYVIAKTGRNMLIYWGNDSYALTEENVVVIDRKLLEADNSEMLVDMAILHELGHFLARTMPVAWLRPQPQSKDDEAWADFYGGEMMGYYLTPRGGADHAGLTRISEFMADLGGLQKKSVHPAAGRRVRLWNLGMASGHARAVPGPASYKSLMAIAGRRLPNDPSDQSYLTFVSQSISSILSGGR